MVVLSGFFACVPRTRRQRGGVRRALMGTLKLLAHCIPLPSWVRRAGSSVEFPRSTLLTMHVTMQEQLRSIFQSIFNGIYSLSSHSEISLNCDVCWVSMMHIRMLKALISPAVNKPVSLTWHSPHVFFLSIEHFSVAPPALRNAHSQRLLTSVGQERVVLGHWSPLHLLGTYRFLQRDLRGHIYLYLIILR